MSRTCTICSHKNRAEIEACLIAKESNREITRKFAVSKDAQYRHKEHITETIAHSQSAKEEVLALSAANELIWANQQMHAIYEASTAGEKPDLKLALQAAAHVTKWAEVWARVQGELDTHIDISVHPDWLVVQKAIMAALQPHLQARIAVGEALDQLNGQERPQNSNYDKNVLYSK